MCCDVTVSVPLSVETFYLVNWDMQRSSNVPTRIHCSQSE